MTILCSFTALEDLWPIGATGKPRRRRGITDADVLRVLDTAKRFSCFEADAALAYVTSLRDRGLVTLDSESIGYPWVRVALTDAGREVLAR